MNTENVVIRLEKKEEYRKVWPVLKYMKENLKIIG